MDTLPSSLSSFKIPNNLIHRKSSDYTRFKPAPPPLPLPLPPPHTRLSQKPTLTTTITSKYINNNNNNLPSSSLQQYSPVLVFHRKAATGYAAALINVAQCSNQLSCVEKDVKRFLKLLTGNHQLRGFMKDNCVNENEKGQVLKEIAENGRFHKYLVVLVRMLADKMKNIEMLAQILMEFQRIFEESMSRTRRI